MSRLWDRVPASRLVCTCCKAPKKNVYMHLSAPFESLLAYFLFFSFLGRWKKRQLNHGRVSFSSSERHETDSTTMRPSRDDVREMHRIKPFKLNVTAIDHDSPLGEDKPSKYRIIQTQQFNVQSDTAIKSSYTEVDVCCLTTSPSCTYMRPWKIKSDLISLMKHRASHLRLLPIIIFFSLIKIYYLFAVSSGLVAVVARSFPSSPLNTWNFLAFWLPTSVVVSLSHYWMKPFCRIIDVIFFALGKIGERNRFNFRIKTEWESNTSSTTHKSPANNWNSSWKVVNEHERKV